MSTTFFLVPLAYDYIQGKTGHGSKARCDALLEFVESYYYGPDVKYVVVLTAGFTKKSTTLPTALQKESLANQQYVYMYQRESTAPDIEYKILPSVWGTHKEISAASKIILDYCKTNNLSYEECRVVTSSNWMHLHGRVKLWWRSCLPNMRVWYRPAKHSFTKKEVVREVSALLRDVLAHSFKLLKRMCTKLH